ncbi:ABC transporter ATP-binding protein [Saccharopolyspora mangrovi]|uniref:ATP-binding cassette domain-containing protein n=1 Tax=Saccharopolyspora mangrovi TaxID=3082379 RepID=A0ABU6A6D5_9PSEU|nr:ATP-binding cassette domain-containing protein [Saccharopolyspora sp. S2-29]MEB3367051.1 ATP-binding cassette domain-containing protein [Saccharopolyspora sp. S2-29]
MDRRPRAVLSATDLVVGYRRGRPVVDGASIDIAAGEVLGLAGPSGSGKSTLGRVLALLHRPWSGRVSLDGGDITGFRHRTPPETRRAIGIVFQHPRPAVDPRFTLREIIAEPLLANGEPADIAEITDEVGLTGELLTRRPHEVSDGQLQRACLARALAPRPRYLVCDEMTAMLDASTTAALVRVVDRQTRENNTGVLAISHDEALLTRWAHRVVHVSELI